MSAGLDRPEIPMASPPDQAVLKTAATRAGLVLLLAWLGLELHEFGHVLVYWASGQGVWISFQRIDWGQDRILRRG